MPLSRWPSKLLVFVVPLAFVVVSWLASAGFPYYLDSNESFLSYLHARNLEIWNPWEYAWMTAEATDPLQPTSGNFYTHNPNAPRYLHYALLRLGVHDLSWQVLILSMLGTGLTAALLWRLWGQPGLLAVPLAVVLDYGGFLSWTVNTYRVWTFVLYFGLALAVMKRRPLWIGALMFALFQIEYGMAIFMAVAVALLAVLEHGWRARSLIVAAGVGASLSVAVFAAQVFTFYGWDGLVHELAITYARRGTAGEAGGLATFVYHAWQGPLLLLASTARETHSVPVLILVVAGILFAARRLIRGSDDAHELFLARLTVATTLGVVASSAALYGYFVDSFVVSLLPLRVLLIAPSAGIVALELRRLLAVRWPSPRLATICTVVAVLPVLAASVARFEPPVGVGLFAHLQTDLRGKSIVGPNLGPWFANPELAFALSGGRAVRTSDIYVTPDDLRRFESLRDADGALTYVCLDTLYIRKMSKLGEPSICGEAATQMVAQGHPVLAEGFGWTIFGVNREARPVTGEAAEPAGGTVEAGQFAAEGARGNP